MALIFGLVDPDPGRRALALGAVSARMSSMVGLPITRWERNVVAVVAAAGPGTPIEEASAEGCWAWVLGDVHTESGGSAAQFVAELAVKGDRLAVNGLNGYYLACIAEPSGAVTLGTDVLGLLPLYYWSKGDAFAFSTSPGLLRLHPSCDSRLSPHGVAGVMLFGHMLNGQTIWQGIRRQEPGRAICWHGTSLTTPLANDLRPDERHFGKTYDEARSYYAEALGRAVGRSIARYRDGVKVLLSGGLDSRLVAGHVAAAMPGRTTAVVFGDRTDQEVRCALRVARALRVPIVRAGPRYEAFARAAEDCIRREHLCNTLWDYTWVSAADVIDGGCQPLANGFLGDRVMGGAGTERAWDPKRCGYSFEPLFSSFVVHGFSPEEIGDIVGDSRMTAAALEVVEEVRTRFEALPGLPFQRSWFSGLYLRMRFHVAAFGWRLADHGWPLMPFTDREILEAAAGMPFNYLEHRRIQVDTLKIDFPRLARLPIDRNTADTTPLAPSRIWSLRSRVVSRVPYRLRSHRERRTYYKTFDINNPGWVAIRKMAESQRHAVGGFLRTEALDRYLPPPGDRIDADDAIIDTSNRKILLSLMILAGQEQAVMDGLDGY